MPPLRVKASRAWRSLATLTAQTKPDQVRVGDMARATRSFTDADVASFAQLSRDSNPLHHESGVASASRFGGRVVHGMLYGSMFSAIIGQLFPGAVYVSQSLRFHKPVVVGDSITAEIEVKEVGARGRLLTFRSDCLNQHGERVLSGEACALLPKDRRKE
ncbi:hypothetical protein AB1Y20_011531 [Prymnesium parvum]|uniref:MaoC-like domain-containing protein n=1 Tax=Prymnesium parvum TaxID=97485 RepID=A0AB34IG80_PRYPA